jgi:glyoxylase-like metal-dependent hydrolase (beta-lactamase superfamily II)
MHEIAPDVGYLDLHFQGVPRLIATAVVETEGGVLLVDPGPTTALDALRDGLLGRGCSLDDVRALLLTHIHLDHAGATGRIVEAHPDVHVYVHERGAPHLADPTKLLRSARRIYGDRLDTLWGDFLAVPEENITALAGGETIAPGGRTMDVAYTPGHASHHVSYLDASTGTAFAGDVAGMRVQGADYVLPVAPPPDIDVAAWHASTAALRDWNPDRLMVTHFSAFDDVARHLDALDERLDAMAAAVRATLSEQEADDDARAARFHTDQVEAMKAHVPEPLWAPYEQFGQPRESWYGLARYWQKHRAAD